jgi:hypothetical protein
MKLLIGGLIIMASLSHMADAQALETTSYTPRHQVTIQGGAGFTRKVTDAGVTYKPTSSGVGLVGYRFNITRWLGVEGDYEVFRNSQKFLTANTQTSLKTNVNVATGAIVINIPNPITKRFRSFVSVGGGAIFFSPTGADFDATERQNVIAFGGGLDFPISRHLAIRGQGNTLMYKAPDFGMSGLRTSKYSQTLVPSAGLVFSF